MEQTSTAPSSRKAPNPDAWWLAAGAVLTIAALGLALGAHFPNSFHGHGARVILSPTSAPALPAIALNIKDGSTSPVPVAGQGTAIVVGVAEGSERSYYLIANPIGTESNVYYADTHNPDAGLFQMTVSPGFKHGLTYDEESGLVAFVTSDTEGESIGTIMLVDNGTTTERMLTEGDAPVFLKGGFFLVYENAGKLFSVNVATRSSHELLSIPEGGAYAIDGNAMRAVIYQPETNTFEYYSLVGMTGASHEHSEKATETGAERILALTGETLVEGIVNPDGLVLRIDGAEPFTVPNSLRYQTAHLTYLP